MFEILAVIGALSWLPFLIRLLQDKITKPKIRIITQRTAEIGFTTLGHIFNLKIAFATQNKDVVISGVKIVLKHDSGEEKHFSWQGIVQNFGELKRAEGNSIPWDREQTVLAMKLFPNNIEERFIRFQEENYLLAKNNLENILVKKYTHLKKNGDLSFEDVQKLEEYQELETYILQSFGWKVGKYSVVFELDSPEKFILLDNIYYFEITALDVDAFAANKDNIAKYYEDVFNSIVDSTCEPKKIVWNWRYPIFMKKS